MKKIRSQVIIGQPWVTSGSADFDQQKAWTGNATKGAVFKLINCLIWYDVELVWLQNCYLGFSKFWKLRKKFEEKIYLKKSLKIKICKNVQYVWGQCLMNMCTNFKSISSKKGLRYDIKHVKNRPLSPHFGTQPRFSEFYFFHRFWRFTKCYRVIFRVPCENLTQKTWIAALNPDSFCLTFFTWWPETTLTCIMVTKHMKWYLQMSVTLSMQIRWLRLRLTLKFYSPMSQSPKILTLTWPVTSSVTSRSNVWPCTGSFRTGLSNGVWNLKIGPVVGRSQGAFAPPLLPQRDVLLTRPQRGEG